MLETTEAQSLLRLAVARGHRRERAPASSRTSVASPSITVARFLIHCSSVIGLSEMMVLAGDVLQLPGVAPVRWVSVLQPEYLRGTSRGTCSAGVSTGRGRDLPAGLVTRSSASCGA